jgi:acid stress chaperone HdeB
MLIQITNRGLTVRKSVSTVFAICLSLLTTQHANALTTDMAQITCDDLAHGYVGDVVVVAAWFSGYYNAKHDNTVIDADRLSDNAKKVMEFCQTNPKVTAMQAIEKLIGPAH